jgi:hypothetical protein
VKITFDLSDGFYAELRAASAEALEIGFRPEDWAQECVQSALASRRLPRVTAGMRGARARTDEPELKSYPLLLPEYAGRRMDR